jgi:serine/threonine protein kinase
MVGEGAYGEVFSATYQRTGEVCAVKKILRTEIDRYVRDECLNLAKCNHSQIITYKDVSFSMPPNRLYTFLTSAPLPSRLQPAGCSLQT